MIHDDLNYQLAEAFIRCFLGILFVFQGYDKLFVVKIKNVVNAFHNDAQQKNVPNGVVVFVSYFTSITEFFGGMFLILGLFHSLVPILLGLNLLIVALGFSFLKPIWDLQHVFPRVVLLVIILLLSPYYYFGVDTLLLK